MNVEVLLIAQTLLVCKLALSVRRSQRRKRLKARRFGVHPMRRERLFHGEYRQLFCKLKADHPDEFKEYVRMSPAAFDHLLGLLRPRLQRLSRRSPISPEERLCVTLRFLGHGLSHKVLRDNFRLGKSTCVEIVNSTCRAIAEVIMPMYIKTPCTAEQWIETAKGFWKTWNLPNCVGAIDGKHIAVRKPKKSGSKYYNYKGFCSSLLLAACDSNYLFTYADVGSYGRQSDGGVFATSDLLKCITNNELHLPVPQDLPGTNIKFPFYWVGDNAFPLMEYMMRPFSNADPDPAHRVANYRLSRARRIIENVFGLMVWKWAVLQKPIQAKGKNVDNIVKSCVTLHNYVRVAENKSILPQATMPDDFDGTLSAEEMQERRKAAAQSCLVNFPSDPAVRRGKQRPIELRELLCQYLNGPIGAAACPYQREKALMEKNND